MITTGELPTTTAQKAELWRTYAELPDMPHALLSDALAQYLIAVSPTTFARLLSEAVANS
ncbi:hypothetical protein J2X46_002742 [Nocardioides sp. BE266]|uniref:hypothetical protein n=1 Tax=Nocardioides sp. BE266 TaxID=2817725 RepID=UPI00285E2796|nr:hypothetical protein [Nocardioides sp. BE266]MDR7253752.1 hypothetical protein [Nocardioides sp. BE266]